MLVTAAAYFAAPFLGQKPKWQILGEKLLRMSRRFFGIPPCRFYALADGIGTVLTGSRPDPATELPPNLQLLLAWPS